MAGLTLAPVDDDSAAIEIQGDRATVGRTAGVDHIVNDPSVSRQHAVFECQGGLWTVTDNRSANGTFLNRRKITTAEIRDGQEIRFGMKAFRVRVDWADLPTALMPADALPPPIDSSPTPSVPPIHSRPEPTAAPSPASPLCDLASTDPVGSASAQSSHHPARWETNSTGSPLGRPGL